MKPQLHNSTTLTYFMSSRFHKIMKKPVLLFCIFFSLIAQAQQSPLLDHAWTIEKIVTEDQIINADPGADGTYDQIQFYYSEFNDNYFYILEEFTASIEFDEDVQNFEILHLEYPIGLYGSDISQFFHFTFLTESLPSDNLVQQPLSYSFLEEGDLIYLYITNANGDEVTFYTTTLSNASFEKVELSIYPNPTSNLLHIEASQTDISRVEVFDVQGKQVMQVSAANLTKLDVSQLTNGMYFLKVSTSDGELTKKFVKK